MVTINGRVYNIGIAAGSASGLAVLDIDPKDNGDESIKQYSVPETLEVITGSGGTHHYFDDPEALKYPVIFVKDIRCSLLMHPLD